MIRQFALAALATATAASLFACTATGTAAITPAPGASTAATMPATGEAPMAVTITMSGNAFSPADAKVKMGGTVTWKNMDAVPHNATFTDTAIKATANITKDQTADIKFEKEGAFDYICTIHPAMKAKITVVK